MLEEVARDLNELQSALRSDSQTEQTADAIATIIGAINAALRTGKELAGDLPIPLPRNQGIHPPNTRMFEARMRFRFLAPRSNAVVEKIVSEIQVCVRARLDVNGMSVDLEDHWRVDTQPQQPGTPREAHPLFHFQRGGHAQDAFARVHGFVPGPAMTQSGIQWRGLMQYPGPRIPIMPMCPTAAFDFVLAHHDGPLWRRLMNIPDYANVVGRCHGRLWQLYEAGLRDAPTRRVLLGHY